MSSGPVAMRRPVEFPVRSEAPTPPRRHGAAWALWPRFVRIALPLAALGLAGLIFAWSRIDPIIEKIHISETEQRRRRSIRSPWRTPRFAGVVAQNRSST